MKLPKILAFISLSAIIACSKVSPPAPYGACPTPQQVAWQRMEINMFCHFGPNTFTGAEWGDGTEAEELFNPTALDCRQWADIAQRAGMGGIILTAKHHDGFCLWPSKQSTHNVAQSSWRGGKGDVLRELSDACTEAGLAMGVYISPWDRNAPTYGTPQYNETFRMTLEEVLSRYGTVGYDGKRHIFEQWFDGANGEGPNGKKQTYDWQLFNGTVQRLQPEALIFSDVGPGCRWVGNESGEAGETCWSTLNRNRRQHTPGLVLARRRTTQKCQRTAAHLLQQCGSQLAAAAKCAARQSRTDTGRGFSATAGVPRCIGQHFQHRYSQISSYHRQPHKGR